MLTDTDHVRCMKCRAEAAAPYEELIAAGWFIKMGGSLCPDCNPHHAE